ncbi:MAG: lipoprotein insertase outer membrane protein LolB [Vicinamibacterales bacterium]
MTRAGGAARAVALAVLLAGPACAARGAARPSGTPADDPSAIGTLRSATTHCRPLRTATAEIRLAGRAGPQRIRARLLAGFAAPASVRLEALAPFGAPAMVLASDGATTTLLFPRERQVLHDAPVAAVLEALTGLALDASELRLMLFGCLAPEPGRGERYGTRWQAVADADSRIFLRDGVPVAADYRGWQIDYRGFVAGVPRVIRVRRAVAAGAIDLTAQLGELAINTDLDARAFVVTAPGDAEVITLDDLRRSSPLTAR